MKDYILQDVAQMIHSYYRARGANLECTSKQVIDYVKEAYRQNDIMGCSNVFLLTSSNLPTFKWQQGDLLVVISNNIIEIYDELNSSHSYYLSDILWIKLTTSHFDDGVTIDELLNRGSVVYLVREFL